MRGMSNSKTIVYHVHRGSLEKPRESPGTRWYVAHAYVEIGRERGGEVGRCTGGGGKLLGPTCLGQVFSVLKRMLKS